MNRTIFTLLIWFLLAINCFPQETKKGLIPNDQVYDKLLKVTWDNNDYITTICRINNYLNFDSTNAYLYYKKSLAEVYLMDFDGACKDITLAIKLSSKIYKDPFYNIYCNDEYKRKLFQKYDYKGIKLVKSNGYRPNYTEKDTIRGKLSPPRSCYNVYYYDLNVRIFPKSKSIKGRSTLYFNVIEATDSIQVDISENYQIDSILWNNDHLTYHRKFDAIFVKFNKDLSKNSKQELTVFYSGEPEKALNPPWQGGFVWKQDVDHHDFISVCCEHLGASCWWPNKDHLSDKPDSMRISIDVPKEDKAISNGNLIKEYDVDGGYHRFIWRVGYPIVNYGVTFYCGNYQIVEDTLIFNSDTLALDYYVLPKHQSQAIKYFNQSKDVLRVYSELFGSYPFLKDGFGLVESPYEGMEHQGAIAFGDNFEKRRKVYTNNEYDYIIVHEIAHEWWGNSLSFYDMADAWLSEGFATYSELLFMEKKYGHLQYYKELRRLMSYIINFWPIVGNYNVNENSFASGDIYYKGAIILHNLRCIIDNDDLFMKLLKDFYQKYKYQSISSKAFTEMASTYTHLNLEPFFNKFLYDSKPPVLLYNLLIENNDVILVYKWNNVDPGFMMPFQVSNDHNVLISLKASSALSSHKFKNTKTIKFINFISANDQITNPNYTYFLTKFDPDLTF